VTVCTDVLKIDFINIAVLFELIIMFAITLFRLEFFFCTLILL